MADRQDENGLSFQEADYLSGYRKQVTSQFGEDGVIEKIFEIMENADRPEGHGLAFHSQSHKWCVEFGAGDGKTFSNIWNLIVSKGWSAVAIEANKKLYKRLIRTYRDNNKVICINKIMNFAGDNTLDGVLSETPIPKDFDLLCVDVDGNDYHIWNSLKRYTPKVVMIEFNPTIPADVEFVQHRDMKISQGSSLLSLTKLGLEKGYELAAALDVNAFFVKQKDYPLFKMKDNSPALVRKINKYETRLFQLYDGTLVLAGNKTFLWRGEEINQDKIQVLPKSLRRYPARISFLRKIFNYLASQKKNA